MGLDRKIKKKRRWNDLNTMILDSLYDAIVTRREDTLWIVDYFL